MYPAALKGAVAVLSFSAACAGLGTAAQGAETGCPVLSGGQRLATIELYDGPVEDNVILAPDRTTGTAAKGRSEWSVGSIYAEKRRLTVACTYSPGGTRQMVEIIKPVNTCSQVLDAKAGGSFTCR